MVTSRIARQREALNDHHKEYDESVIEDVLSLDAAAFLHQSDKMLAPDQEVSGVLGRPFDQ